MTDENLPVPAGPSPDAIAGEIEAIRSEMSSPAYWRDEAKQARYRELVTMRDRTPAENAAPDVRSIMDQTGMSPDYAQKAVDRAMAASSEVPEHLRRDFDMLGGSFGDRDRAMILAEIGYERPHPVDYAPAHVVDLLARDGCAALFREWGSSTPYRVGVFQARARRLQSALTANGRAQAKQILDNANPAELAAIVRMLSY